MNQTFGAQILMTKPADAITVPAIVTVRHPNLLVRALTMGPKQFQMKLLAINICAETA